MGGWAASSSHIPFKKHGEPPHPDTGKVEYDKQRGEYVTFGGVPVYGNWNEVSGVKGKKGQTIHQRDLSIVFKTEKMKQNLKKIDLKF